MNETLCHPDDPRWGQDHREAKAEALYRTLQLHAGDLPDHATWLDIGCGSGGIAATLASRVKRMIGIDPESWERWQTFKESHANLEFHNVSYRELENLLGPESMDVIICNQVYEHVDDPVALLQSIHAVLKPDGLCYFAGPNLLWPIEPHVFWPFVHWLPRHEAQRLMRILGSRQAEDLDAFSTHHWQLKKWFQDVGLTWRPAVAARINGMLAVRGWTARVPRWVAACIDGMTALAPGFVYILRKS